MSSEDIFVVSRPEAPVDIASKQVFEELPDLIQEAAVSTEFQRHSISKVYNNPNVTRSLFVAQPVFYITQTDSGVNLPELIITDAKLIKKYGSHLMANYTDIKAYGPKAFFQKTNLSNNTPYSLCTCATGYIWLYVSREQVQIGTFSLKSRTIATTEIPFTYKYSPNEPQREGQLSQFFSTVLAHYIKYRIRGQQYEDAMERSIKESRKELAYLSIVDPYKFDDLNHLLRQICINAPLPPISDVSMISRRMITRRWQCWRDGRVLGVLSAPHRLAQCFTSKRDYIDLLNATITR